MRQQQAGLRLAVRGMRHRKIGGGIDQHLAGDRGPVAVARRYRDHRGEVAAGAVAADAQPGSIDAELFGVVGDPFGRGDGVIDRGGKLVFGREAIIDRYHEQPALVGELAAHHVVGIEIADHPAAAVKEHQHGCQTIGPPRIFRRVDARGEWVRAGRGSPAVLSIQARVVRGWRRRGRPDKAGAP